MDPSENSISASQTSKDNFINIIPMSQSERDSYEQEFQEYRSNPDYYNTINPGGPLEMPAEYYTPANLSSFSNRVPITPAKADNVTIAATQQSNINQAAMNTTTVGITQPGSQQNNPQLLVNSGMAQPTGPDVPIQHLSPQQTPVATTTNNSAKGASASNTTMPTDGADEDMADSGN